MLSLVSKLVKSLRGKRQSTRKKVNYVDLYMVCEIMAYSVRYTMELGPEVQAPLLRSAPSNDVLDCGVPYMSNRQNDRSGCSPDCAKVMSVRENWPTVGDCTEVQVLCVIEKAAGDELSTKNCVLTGLEGCAAHLWVCMSGSRMF